MSDLRYGDGVGYCTFDIVGMQHGGGGDLHRGPIGGLGCVVHGHGSGKWLHPAVWIPVHGDRGASCWSGEAVEVFRHIGPGQHGPDDGLLVYCSLVVHYRIGQEPDLGEVVSAFPGFIA